MQEGGLSNQKDQVVISPIHTVLIYLAPSLSLLLLYPLIQPENLNSNKYIYAYREGLTGAQSAWANKRYHGHCTLPSVLAGLS